MNLPDDLARLTQLFERLGARDPEGWARSQLDEGIPQLQRFLFLRQAWSEVVGDLDVAWIAAHVEQARKSPDDPYTAVGAALERCIAKGVDPQDLTDVVRGMQAELLFRFCYLLDDPGLTEPELDGFAWGLFETDDEGNPTGTTIVALHESVLETDPTGREMRPRGA